MSWWVMEQVSVNESGTQTLANIQCDDVSDLPTPDQSATLGYVIVRGSQAKVLATSEKYILGSTGIWVKMEDGVKLDLTGYATTQDLSDGLAGKVDTSTYTAGQAAQETEIGAVAALGAKNLFKNDKNAGTTITRQGATWVFDQTSIAATVSGSVGATWSDVFLLNFNFDLSDQEYKIVIESDNPDIFVYIPGNTLSGGNIPANGQYYAGVYRYRGIMTTSTRFTAKTASYADNFIRCMICPAAITDNTYVPYAPTNRELYEMILALQ